MTYDPPPMSSWEYETLKQDVRKNGILVPIVLDQNGNVIDGHHRLRIVKELRLKKYPTERVRITDEHHLQQLVVEYNLMRRQLSPSQAREWYQRAKKVALKAREQGATQTEAAQQAGVSQQQVSAWQSEDSRDPSTNTTRSISTGPVDSRVKVPTAEHEPIWERWHGGESQESIGADYKVTQRAISTIAHKVETRKLQEAEKLEVSKNLPKVADLWCGDFRQLGSKIPDNTVDLVLTDPPYEDKALPLYGDVARLAARILRPGGLLICYAGIYKLPEILKQMDQEPLVYMWTMAMLYTQMDLFNKYNLYQGWKALPIFFKPPLNPVWNDGRFQDTFTGAGVEKSLYRWQQPQADAEQLIRSFVPKGGIVVDPMMGVGTVPAAAKACHVRFIGIELDRDRWTEATQRAQ